MVFALLASHLAAAPPAWWTSDSPNTRIITPGAPPNNSGPVNQGQLKNVAKKAALYFDNALPGYGSRGRIRSMVSGYHPAASDLLPVNLGQLKAVARPFYDRLHNLGFNTKLSLQGHGAAGWLYDYPWNPATPKDANLAPANLGQLKWVFSFDLTGFSILDIDVDKLPDIWEVAHGLDPNDPGDGATSDIDEDGLPDWWEIQWGMDPSNGDEDADGVPDVFEDFDGDGISNEEEAAFHLNPYSTDTDGDSMPDDYELAHDFDPSNSADGSQDIDEDGSSNAAEYAAGTDPTELVEPDPKREVELWMQILRQDWNGVVGTWEDEPPELWHSVKWVGPKSAGMHPNWLGGFAESYTRSKSDYYFKNLGDNPAMVRWVYFYNQWSPSKITKVISNSELVAAGSNSQVFHSSYPTGSDDWDGIFSIPTAEAAPESGFDNFERYAAPGSPPNDLECPWLMVPSEQAPFVPGEARPGSFQLYFSADSAGDIDLSTSPSMTVVNSDTNVVKHKFDTSGWQPYTVNCSAEGTDGYVSMTADNPPNAAKIVRTAVLQKITYTVQPYKVTLRTNLPNGNFVETPPQVPFTEQDIKNYLDEVYGKQMNVYFEVEDFIPITVAYDVGGGTQYPDMEANNKKLDFRYSETEPLSPEEAALYAKGQNWPGRDVVDINLYFLPGGMKGHGNGNANDGFAGYARPTSHAALLMGLPTMQMENEEVLSLTPAIRLLTIAHEIGHLNVQNGKGLFHTREKYGFYPQYPTRGFPLLRLSDERRRLMWWTLKEKPTNPNGHPAALLIKEEWMKWRTGQP